MDTTGTTFPACIVSKSCYVLSWAVSKYMGGSFLQGGAFTEQQRQGHEAKLYCIYTQHNISMNYRSQSAI